MANIKNFTDITNGDDLAGFPIKCINLNNQEDALKLIEGVMGHYVKDMPKTMSILTVCCACAILDMIDNKTINEEDADMIIKEMTPALDEMYQSLKESRVMTNKKEYSN